MDSKDPKTQELTKDAPSILEFLCDDCAPHFQKVQTYLTEMNIPFVVNPRMVRGLDYYTQTAFEIMVQGIGAIGTVCGGGRYNGLVEQIGGQDMPGIGFALSIERLLLALKTQEVELPINRNIDCFVVTLGEAAKQKSVSLVHNWRTAGLRVEKDYLDRNMKPQMKSADRLGARFVVILGDDELEKNSVVVKEMASGEQQELGFEEAKAYMLTALVKEEK